jgi:hypothetical protein
VLLFWERRAGSKKDFAICPLNGFVELALRELNRIGEWEDNGTRVQCGHGLHYGLVECTL